MRIRASPPWIRHPSSDGLRGLAYFELWVRGPEHDLHSGVFGGIVHNPAQVLCELIAGMHDAEGRVTLPGYYDKVRARLADPTRADIGPHSLRRSPGAKTGRVTRPGTTARRGYTNVERTGARPTLEMGQRGLYSGFIGERQPRPCSPPKAMAKISMRLVADQYPEEVATGHCVTTWTSHAPPRRSAGNLKASRRRPRHPHPAQLTAQGGGPERRWKPSGAKPLFKREGGTVPVVSQMQHLLGVELVLTGFGLPDDNLHAPNEKLHLPTWYRGIEAFIHFFSNL